MLGHVTCQYFTDDVLTQSVHAPCVRGAPRWNLPAPDARPATPNPCKCALMPVALRRNAKRLGSLQTHSLSTRPDSRSPIQVVDANLSLRLCTNVCLWTYILAPSSSPRKNRIRAWSPFRRRSLHASSSCASAAGAHTTARRCFTDASTHSCKQRRGHRVHVIFCAVACALFCDHGAPIGVLDLFSWRAVVRKTRQKILHQHLRVVNADAYEIVAFRDSAEVGEADARRPLVANIHRVAETALVPSSLQTTV